MNHQLATLFPEPFVRTEQPPDTKRIQIIRIPHVKQHGTLISVCTKQSPKGVDRRRYVLLIQAAFDRNLDCLLSVFLNFELHDKFAHENKETRSKSVTD